MSSIGKKKLHHGVFTQTVLLYQTPSKMECVHCVVNRKFILLIPVSHYNNNIDIKNVYKKYFPSLDKMR